MGLFTRQKATPQQRSAHLVGGSLQVPSWGGFGAIAEAEAKRIPAYLRGLRLISGTVAQLPMVLFRDGVVAPDQPRVLQQPEPDRAMWVTAQRTVEDIVQHGRAYWLVTDLTRDGYPRAVRQINAAEVGDDPRGMDPDAVTWSGRRYEKSNPAGPGSMIGTVIAFYGFESGVLANGATILQTAVALEDAVQNYAATPLPAIALKNEGADLTPDQVSALLDAWEKARANRSTAYLNSVISTETFGWDAGQIQLVEARNQAAVQIARLLGLDPMWVGANIPGGGSTLTYTNRVDLRKDLVDLTLTDYIAPIEQRLSMRDCTPTINAALVRFDLTEFLRSSLDSRAQIVSTLLPLNAITIEEARALLQYAPNEHGELQ